MNNLSNYARISVPPAVPETVGVGDADGRVPPVPEATDDRDNKASSIFRAAAAICSIRTSGLST